MIKKKKIKEKLDFFFFRYFEIILQQGWKSIPRVFKRIIGKTNGEKPLPFRSFDLNNNHEPPAGNQKANNKTLGKPDRLRSNKKETLKIEKSNEKREHCDPSKTEAKNSLERRQRPQENPRRRVQLSEPGLLRRRRAVGPEETKERSRWLMLHSPAPEKHWDFNEECPETPPLSVIYIYRNLIAHFHFSPYILLYLFLVLLCYNFLLNLDWI